MCPISFSREAECQLLRGDMRRLFTMIELIITLSVVVILAFLFVGLVVPDTIEPQEVKLPVGSKIESSGDRIIAILDSQGTRDGLLQAVTKWLKEHPDYQIETLTPADYSGGGEWRISPNAYLIVASKKE